MSARTQSTTCARNGRSRIDTRPGLRGRMWIEELNRGICNTLRRVDADGRGQQNKVAASRLAEKSACPLNTRRCRSLSETRLTWRQKFLGTVSVPVYRKVVRYSPRLLRGLFHRMATEEEIQTWISVVSWLLPTPPPYSQASMEAT